MDDYELTSALETLSYRLIAGAEDGRQALARVEAIRNWAEAQAAGLTATAGLWDVAESIGAHTFPIAAHSMAAIVR